MAELPARLETVERRPRRETRRTRIARERDASREPATPMNRLFWMLMIAIGASLILLMLNDSTGRTFGVGITTSAG